MSKYTGIIYKFTSHDFGEVVKLGYKNPMNKKVGLSYSLRGIEDEDANDVYIILNGLSAYDFGV